MLLPSLVVRCPRTVGRFTSPPWYDGSVHVGVSSVFTLFPVSIPPWNVIIYVSAHEGRDGRKKEPYDRERLFIPVERLGRPETDRAVRPAERPRQLRRRVHRPDRRRLPAHRGRAGDPDPRQPGAPRRPGRRQVHRRRRRPPPRDPRHLLPPGVPG